MDTSGGDPPTREPVHEGDVGARSPAQAEGVVLDAAHGLRTAGEHHVCRARLDPHGGVHDGLQPGSAATVHLHTRNVDRQTGVECRGAADRRFLAVGVGLAQNDVVDGITRQVRALEQGSDHGRGQRRGGDAFERSSEASHRGTDRGTDDGISHRRLRRSR
jgi:hypothetical protein